MTPLPFDEVVSLKRNSTTASFDAPAAKKQNRGPLRHHRPTWPPTQSDRHQAAPQDGESVDTLLERAIILALEAVGFSGIDPHALQAFRLEVQECRRMGPIASPMVLTLTDMLHFLGDVRQFMLSSRRVQPIPADFLQSLHTHQLLLASLLPHLNPPVSAEKSQVTLPFESAAPTEKEQQISLASSFNGGEEYESRPYIPDHFPTFPSQHTYKATPWLPSMQKDPRKVRELASEEARLGEAALRRLMGAKSDMNTSYSLQSGKGEKSMRKKRDDVWKEAMQAVTPVPNDGLEIGDKMHGLEEHKQDSRSREVATGSSVFLSTSVNAGKQYWRRPGARRTINPSAHGSTI